MTEPTDLQIVSALEDARFAAMTSQDAETLERLLSDDLVYTHSSGSIDTKTTFLHNVRNGPAQYRSADLSDVNARVVGDSTAIFTGRARLIIEHSGKPLDLDLRYLAVWVKRADTWRFEAWQSTPAKH